MQKDAFDYYEEDGRKSRGDSGAMVWNILSVLVLLTALCIGGVFLTIFINPQSGLNPFPPATLPVLVGTHTPTPTSRAILPPTWTPTPSAAPSATPTPEPTYTLTPEGKAALAAQRKEWKAFAAVVNRVIEPSPA